MLALHPNEIVIHGTTSNGKTFRPSDWSERLCGILSSFDKGNRLAYHEWVRPILVGKVRCVAVDKKLEEINQPMFKFLMDFAADNDLRVFDYDGLQQELEAAEQAAAQPAPQPTPVQAAPAATQSIAVSVREIASNEVAVAFAALSTLITTQTDLNRFVEQISQMQKSEGYRMIGIFEENKNNAVAVCGFRIRTHLAHGKHIRIDDIATVTPDREQSYVAQLLAEIVHIAKNEGIAQIHADVDSTHSDLHRLYFKHGFEIAAYHFVCPTQSFVE